MTERCRGLPVTPRDYNMRWHDRAACRHADPTLFLTPDDDGEAPDARHARHHSAKQYCAACPVTAECLQQALDLREVGVWGGLTDRQRHQLTKRPTA